MTDFLVSVANAGEARMARAAGADLLAHRGPAADIVAAAAGARVLARVDSVADARARRAEGAALLAVPADADLSGFADLARQAPCWGVLYADRASDPAALDRMVAAGFSGALLDTAQKQGARLLALMDIGRIATFVERAHALGLSCGLAGRLQAPDIPRLMVLRPDSLGFRSALCAEGAGGLDAHALALFRSLIPRERAGGALHAAGTDRVFVRDFVIEAEIGAYAHERNARQRVRFDVEAEVRRRPRGDDDFQNVFSYDVITDAIRRFATSGHITLVETLAERIAETTLRDRHVVRVRVRVEKLDVIDGAVGVEIVRERN